VRLLDLFCGRFGWGKVFAARGWEVFGVDLVEPPEIPEGCRFIKADILAIESLSEFGADFGVGSSPCEQFSLFGMKHFHPNPPHPELGIRLFNHTRYLFERAGIPYVMENVRPAQKFVGNAIHHCGPFYLWGPGVPILMPQGIKKGVEVGSSKVVNKMSTLEERREYRKENGNPAWAAWSGSKARADATAKWATIPPELANCVCDYAERILCTTMI
jgi:23S rRNA U2552 (ribose-2'-O)-methylase RlmE/FtsJ